MSVHNRVREGIICEVRYFTSRLRKAYRAYKVERTKRERQRVLESKNKILSIISQYINKEQLEYIEEQRPQGNHYYQYYLAVTKAVEEINKFHRYKLTDKNYKPNKKTYENALKFINQFEEIKIASNFPKARGAIFTELIEDLERSEMMSNEDIETLYNTIKNEFDYKDNSKTQCNLHSNRLPQRETHRNKSWDFLKKK